MAAQAKGVRDVKKDDLEDTMDEASDTMEKMETKSLRTNVLRTLETRRTSLIRHYDDWHRACSDYSCKVAATATSEQKTEDATVNIKPIKKKYVEILDRMNDLIEDAKITANSLEQIQNKRQELEIQIERSSRDIKTKIDSHKERSCPSEISRSARDRLFKELDRDVTSPMKSVSDMFIELMKLTESKTDRDKITAEEDKWMAENNKLLMEISDKFASIPGVEAGGDDLDISVTSRAGLKVKKADPPRFDGRIPSYPRFKKDFKSLMQDYDDASQVYYIRGSLTSEDKNLIKTLDTMKEVWNSLDKRYKHSDIGANSLLESFYNYRTPPGSNHTQFNAIYLKYKELKDGLESLEEIQYLKNNPAFRKTLLSKLPSRMKEKLLEKEAREKESSEEKGETLDRFQLMDNFMEYQFKISMSVESVDRDTDKKARCFICNSTEHRKKDCPTQSTCGGKKFNATTSSQASSTPVSPCRCCGLAHVNPSTGKQFSRLSRCDKFRNMDLQGRVTELERLSGCALCLDSTGRHQRNNCIAKNRGGEPFKNCSMLDPGGNKCGRKHNPWVHGSSASYVNAVKSSQASVLDKSQLDLKPSEAETVNTTNHVKSVADEFLNEEEDVGALTNDPANSVPVADELVLLLMQFVPCRVGRINKPTLTFFDHGSTMGLITHSHAKTLRLEGWDASQWVQVASKPWELWQTKIYLVPMVDREGRIHRVKCFGAESITSKLEKVNIDGIIHHFPQYKLNELARPYGEV